MSASVVDARRVINEVLVKRMYSVDEMRDQIRSKIVSALRFGKPLHIRLHNTAMDWTIYCCEGGLPPELFHAALWKQTEVWSRVASVEEMEGGWFNLDTHFVFVTSDFDLAGVKEHLPSKLPLFERLAIININPRSIASATRSAE